MRDFLKRFERGDTMLQKRDTTLQLFGFHGAGLVWKIHNRVKPSF